MKRQQTMKMMKDMTKKIRSKGRRDADNRWWVSELLAADCEKACRQAGREETMQKWCDRVGQMKKKDEKEKMEEMHQHEVVHMIKSEEGSVGLLHKISKPTAWRRGAQIFVNEEDDAKLLDRCEAKLKARAKHWHCDKSVQNMKDSP